MWIGVDNTVRVVYSGLIGHLILGARQGFKHRIGSGPGASVAGLQMH